MHCLRDAPSIDLFLAHTDHADVHLDRQRGHRRSLRCPAAAGERGHQPTTLAHRRRMDRHLPGSAPIGAGTAGILPCGASASARRQGSASNMPTSESWRSAFAMLPLPP